MNNFRSLSSLCTLFGQQIRTEKFDTSFITHFIEDYVLGLTYDLTDDTKVIIQ